MSAVLWFRRDLRLGDHPALLAAADEGPVVALFVLDDVLRKPSGVPRVAFLYRTLRALDALQARRSRWSGIAGGTHRADAARAARGLRRHGRLHVPRQETLSATRA